MEVLHKLVEFCGTYRGKGINHENEDFIGEIIIASILDGKGIEILYEALGKDKTVFHKEKTLIATDFFGKVKMWNLNSNSPGMTELELRSDENVSLVFGIGDIEDKNSFREEIKIELLNNKVGYHYSWGMPGGEYSYRSGLIMEKDM